MTIKMFTLLKKRPDLSDEEFRAYYEGNHAPLAQSLIPQIGYYARHYIRQDTVMGVRPGARPWVDIDCINEIHFADQAAFDEMLEVAADQRILDDEANLFDLTSIYAFIVDTVESAPRKSDDGSA